MEDRSGAIEHMRARLRRGTRRCVDIGRLPIGTLQGRVGERLFGVERPAIVLHHRPFRLRAAGLAAL